MGSLLLIRLGAVGRFNKQYFYSQKLLLQGYLLSFRVTPALCTSQNISHDVKQMGWLDV